MSNSEAASTGRNAGENPQPSGSGKSPPSLSVQSQREALELRKIRNDIWNNWLKTGITAVSLTVAFWSAITGGIKYFEDREKALNLIESARLEKQQLNLTTQATATIKEFLDLKGAADTNDQQATQIPAAVLLRGLKEPGAAIIRDSVYFAATGDVARILGMSYANIARTSELSNETGKAYQLVRAFMTSIDTSWRAVRTSFKNNELRGTVNQFVAFSFVVPVMEGAPKQDIEAIFKTVSMIKADLENENNEENTEIVKVCKALSSKCNELKGLLSNIENQLGGGA